MRIMTGALLPPGADAVVKQEDVEADDRILHLRHPIKNGQGVRMRGSEVRRGGVALRKGAVIGPEEAGFLASLGVRRVEVFARPRIALIMIGDELVPPGEVPPPGKIRVGNALMLYSLVCKYGGLPLDTGIVQDRKESIAEAMGGAAHADMVITSGGSGGGVHDLTSRALGSAGGEILFEGVSIWPGGTLSFGVLNGTPFFILPGGPRTASICFHIFVREALAAVCPTEMNFPWRLSATASGSLRGRPGVTSYIHVDLKRGKRGYYATRSRAAPQPNSRSALAVLPPGIEHVRRGEKVEVLLL